MYPFFACKHTRFSSTHFLIVPVFLPSAGTLPASGCSGIMRPLVVIFHQPALSNFPCFTQCSEQVKIQDFCSVCSVEPFYKSILCRLTRLERDRLYREVRARHPERWSRGTRNLQWKEEVMLNPERQNRPAKRLYGCDPQHRKTNHILNGFKMKITIYGKVTVLSVNAL